MYSCLNVLAKKPKNKPKNHCGIVSKNYFERSQNPNEANLEKCISSDVKIAIFQFT